jgi:hypothetical protein
MEQSQNQLETPILFITFCRPDTTAKVFERIRQAHPTKLYIAQNIPKRGDSIAVKKWEKVRSIIEEIDWDCEVQRLYREQHLDAKTSISTAINWFFENEEEGIILEDDCLPDPTFFRFCEELLEKYRDDERIAMISGDNFQFGKRRTNYSYYFSRYAHIWGWATWKRAWENYDVEMELWPEIRDEEWLDDINIDKKSVKYWTKMFEKTYMKKIDTWDYQWTFSCMIQNSLTILPNYNLVSNIGFGKDSTFTHNASDKRSNIPVRGIEFPLKSPPFLLPDSQTERDTLNLMGFSLLSWIKKQIVIINQTLLLTKKKV